MGGKRQLLLELLAKDSTGPATKSSSENLDKVAVSAEEAARATDNLGDQAEQSKEEVERFGKSNKTAAEHAEALKLEIESVERELHQLAIAFAEAETAADRADFSKAIRKTQSDLRKLNKSKGLIEDLVPTPAEVEQGLDKLAPTFGQKLKEVWSQAGEAAGPALWIGAAAAAPFLGAAVAGAVIGGVGIGGIAGGLLLASKDPKVSSALDALKKETGDRLKDAAAPFVPVALAGIHQIDGALKGIDFKGIFADAAKESGPLITGIADLLSGLGRGVTDLIHNAGPAVKAIGDGIGEIGNAIGDGLSELSKDGKQGADALRDLFVIIDGGTRLVFGLIDGLTRVYGAAEKINSLTGGGLLDNIEKWQDYHQAISGAAQATLEQAAAAAKGVDANRNWANAADVAAKAAQGQRSALADLANQLHAQIDPAFAVIDAQDKLQKAHKDSATAVKKYGDNSEQAKAANRRLALAALDLTDAVGKAGGSLNGKITPALRNTLHAAGLTDAEIDSVAASFRQAKADGDKFAKNYRATITVSSTGLEKLDPSGHRLGGYRAEGGPVKKGRAYVVGERRPELFVPDRDGTIIPSIDRLGGSGAGSSGAGGAPQLVIDFANADGTMATALIRLFRTNPGFRIAVAKLLAA